MTAVNPLIRSTQSFGSIRSQQETQALHILLAETRDDRRRPDGTAYLRDSLLLLQGQQYALDRESYRPRGLRWKGGWRTSFLTLLLVERKALEEFDLIGRS